MNVDNIYSKIGKVLWEVFPENASEINYFAQLYESNNSQRITFLIEQKVHYADFKLLQFIGDRILNLIEELQKEPIFHKEPWTHLHYQLTDNGEFSIKFAYIDEEDSYGGLYLRGISDLDKDELYEFNVPEDLWLEMKKKYGK